MAGTQMKCSNSLRGLRVALAIFAEPLLHGAHGAERYAAPFRKTALQECAVKQGSRRMPLMQRFMKFVSRSGIAVRRAPARAVSAVRADAHQGARDRGRLAHACAYCCRSMRMSRNPGGVMFGGYQAALADPIAALACARVFPGLFGVDARHDDFLRSRREF